ncbi:Serine-protein kinase RsbW [subsurface metagenome]
MWKSGGGASVTNNVIELRVPIKSEYLVILRAITGVVAGVISLNYADIMQVRAAVSELFDLAIKHVSRTATPSELDVRLIIQPDKMEILIMGPKGYTNHLGREQGKETLALLRSLTDEIEFGTEVAGKSLVRIVKCKSLESVT